MRSGSLGPDLERLPGVLAATVFADHPHAHAPLVYLAVEPQADPSALRDVVLALVRDRGLRADPDRVHIATPPRVPRLGSALPRFTLDALDVRRTEGRAECQVRLRTAAGSPTGSASEPDTDTGRVRAAARALLEAAEGLDPDLRLGLHGVRRLDLFGEPAVVVLVEAVAGRGHARLSGSALVERSGEEAAALATISALRSWTP